MEKQTLMDILPGKIYRIPNYQRGYAWEEKQWDDFLQDLDATIEDGITSHYTGTVVMYKPKNGLKMKYGVQELEVADIVDGQQRLTTSCLYLSLIINKLISRGFKEYENEKSKYLYSGSISRIKLNNDSENIFLELLRYGKINTKTDSSYQERICRAYSYLGKHLEDQENIKNKEYDQYLQNLFDTITLKLTFTRYVIEEQCEIGMTFELMNSRGKDLSILELLKNYLMYWISRNVEEDNRDELTNLINTRWKEAYKNLGLSNNDEDQCLRVAWNIYCSFSPKSWSGYEGFKDSNYIPIRDFSKKTKADTLKFTKDFVDGLAIISKHYAFIINPLSNPHDEYIWISKILNTGNIANFLTLIVAARIKFQNGEISEKDYIDLLKALECYSYRVFLFEGKRSNAGISSLYRLGNELFWEPTSISEILKKIYGLIEYYSNEKIFKETIDIPSDAYSYRRLLKYTLFEYELYLIEKEGKRQKPRLEWKDISDSTIEHILPQEPKNNSEWRKIWTNEDFDKYIHDIGNLVLTVNNSNYNRFEFDRKKGEAGKGFCYANSDIRQERKIASYQKWDKEALLDRRKQITDWIKTRWCVTQKNILLPLDMNEDENETNIIS